MSDPSAPPDVGAPATEVLRFEPWQSAVDPTFWAELARRKLDTFGLSEDSVPVDAQFACATHADVSSPAQLDRRAFEAWSATSGDARASGRMRMPGSLRNVNTFERFKAFDRVAMQNEAGRQLWRSVVSGEALEDPSTLVSFVVLTFADLKSWTFSYWFCFPALKTNAAVRAAPAKTRNVDDDLAESSHRFLETQANPAFAWATRVSHETGARKITHAPLTEMNAMLAACRAARRQKVGKSDADGTAENDAEENVYLSFLDPCSNPDHPGWALRNLTTLAAARFDLGDDRRLSVLSVRKRAGRVSPEHSRVFELVFPEETISETRARARLDYVSDGKSDAHSPVCPFPVVGWEVNPKGRAGPRRADLGESMDPTRLAIAAAELNLKLMRWRLLPDLDLKKIAETKCLLVGAGTLGCAVARCLLGWGATRFTFVDSGVVSFSNPVRQSLFEFADCLDGGKPKAEAAAANLARVFPGVHATGVKMSVPMPGHPVSSNDAARVLKDVARLEALIKAHDAVFCLTDTRESRWLPTLLCAVNNTTLINAALGFDSYLVMRHGAGFSRPRAASTPKKKSSSDDSEKNGPKRDASSPRFDRLGCYFCNDVMAPGDSTRDRTLDQQCTVTRPGLAPIAGALAAEMLVALRQWRGDDETDASGSAEEKKNAQPPAHVGAPGVGEAPPTPLGIVPHQIRGHVSSYAQTLFAAPAFDKCTACSRQVVRLFRGLEEDEDEDEDEASSSEEDKKRRADARDAFLLAAFADPTFLEDATGLTAVHRAADDAEWLGSDGSDGDDF